jgi:hypothetical protein
MLRPLRTSSPPKTLAAASSIGEKKPPLPVASEELRMDGPAHAAYDKSARVGATFTG